MVQLDQITFTEKIWSCEGGSGLSIPYQPHRIPMQFTGLQDSNGKEIYEGDILKFEGTIYTYEVRFENASFVCYHCKKDWGRWGNLNRIKDHDFSDSKINIIGNIYENPELLTP